MFSSREDYGLRAVLDLATHGLFRPVQTKEIAQRQHIPEAFLNQILASLRRAGLVESVRGAGGGYRLARPAREIRVIEVLKALKGDFFPLPSPHPQAEYALAVQELWMRARQSALEVLEKMTLEDLLRLQQELNERLSIMANI